MKIIQLGGLLLCLFIIPRYATAGDIQPGQQPKALSIIEAYKLKEICGQFAAKVFKKEHGNGLFKMDDGTPCKTVQSNHYNRKLNICFYLLTTRCLPNKNLGDYVNKELWDIHEEKQYGIFIGAGKMPSLMGCKVRGKPCQSEKEWDDLIRPLMEE